jgi:hypothetical protein
MAVPKSSDALQVYANEELEKAVEYTAKEHADADLQMRVELTFSCSKLAVGPTLPNTACIVFLCDAE